MTRVTWPRHLAGLVGLITVSLAWSGGWIALKVGVSDASPVAVTTLRFVVAGTVLLLIARAWGPDVPVGRWRDVVGLAVLLAFGYNLVVAFALTLAPASDAGFLVNGLMPILAGAMAPLLAAEAITRRNIAGLLLGASGVALIVLPGASAIEGAPFRLAGDLLLVFGALAWALYTIRGKPLLARPQMAVAVSGVIWTIGGALLLPVALVEGGLSEAVFWSMETWTAVAYLVFVGSAFGFAAYYALVAALGPVRAASTVYLVPVGTLLLAAVLLGEPLYPQHLVGGAVTLFGVYLALERRGRPDPDRDLTGLAGRTIRIGGER